MTSQPPAQDQRPLSFWEVLGEEYWQYEPVPEPPDEAYLKYVRLKEEYGGRWRYLQQLKSGTVGSDPQGFQTARQACEEAEKEFREHLCGKYLHKKTRSALCFSGGGIRSAIFGLGVLQGLAKHSWKKDDTGEHGPKLLSEFDYLSTVSGGGYVGSWFSAWIERERRTIAEQPQESEQKTISRIDPDEQAVKKVIAGLVATPEADPVFHLRRYSNYLTPQMGYISADTWTWVATLLRNIFLNWLVVLPVLAAVLLIPKLSIDLATLTAVPNWLAWFVVVLGILAGALAYTYLLLELPSAGIYDHGQGRFLAGCLAMVSTFAWCLSLIDYWLMKGRLEGWKAAFPHWNRTSVEMSAFIGLLVVIVVLGAVVNLVAAFWEEWRKKTRFGERWNEARPKLKKQAKWLAKASVWMAVTTVLADFMVYRVIHWVYPVLRLPSQTELWDTNTKLYMVFAFPAVIAIVVLTQAVLVGFASRFTTDEDREWWGRAGGWLILGALAWMAGSALVLFAAESLSGAAHAGRWIIATVISGGIASALGFSDKTKAVDIKIPLEKLSKSEKAKKFGLQVILLLFLLLLVPALAAVTATLRDWAIGTTKVPAASTVYLRIESLLAIFFLAVSVFMAYFVDINKFSLHGMYRERLIRAFLGASNKQRSPSWFTGFDPKDNLSMYALLRKPLHVINMSLNLVKGEELAWQERKAESCTSSAMHSGCMWVGYQRSNEYGRANKLEDEPDRISLGGAVAVSGAAATPNMGYHSSPLLTAVMTLFNARLGAWMPNPGQAGHRVWDQGSPKWALTPFYDEAFGLTNDTHEWVYLSDGGHFENLGLYEMVARRCHYILAIDAGCDPDYQHGDLIKAMRKIRTDLGIPIEFSDGLPISTTGDKEGKHYAIGHIHYSHVDPRAEPGILIYVQPSLTGNESRDVADYRTQHANFPQQPTTDQWFDESQFESYRCLGEHVIREIFGEGESDAPGSCGLEEFFAIAQTGKVGAFLRKVKAAVGS